MKFLDFDRTNIVQNSAIVENGYYEYTLGSHVEITTIKSIHSNSLISENLSSNVKDDKLMIKYTPTNKVLFSPSFIEFNTDEFFASCYIDKECNRVFVGAPNEFGTNTGVLVFSGYLSMNNLVEADRYIMCNKRFLNTIRDRVRVLSVGVRGDKLYALWYIPSVKGVAIGIRDQHEMGISPTTLRINKYKDYYSFNIKEWFNNAKVREI